jgi:hypothetical protein
MRSAVCLSVSPTNLLNQLVDSHEIQQGGQDTESDLGAMILTP